jgi:hypothetical protein
MMSAVTTFVNVTYKVSDYLTFHDSTIAFLTVTCHRYH